MAITAADVKAFAPEFTDVSDANVNLWIGWADGAISLAVYGLDTDQGRLLWVCHGLSRTANGAGITGGAVTKDQVGPATRENAAPVGLMAQNAWGTSGYGQMLIALARRKTAGGAIV